jgi:hypothetical protein
MSSHPGHSPPHGRRPGCLEVVRAVLQAALTVLALLRLIGGGGC